MERIPRYQSFLATSSKKFLKVGFLVAIAAVILAFKIPFPENSVKEFTPPTIGEAPPIFTISDPIVKQKEVPPVAEEPIKNDPPIVLPIDDILDPLEPEDKREKKKIDIQEPVDLAPDTSGIHDDEDIPWIVPPEKAPEFPGGQAALLQYLGTTKFCAEANREGIEGLVAVSFIVNKKGKITDVKLAKSLHPCLDAAALEKVKNMPDWSPGEHGLQKVSVHMTVPFNFKLN